MFSIGCCILAFFFCVLELTAYLLLPEERKCLEVALAVNIAAERLVVFWFGDQERTIPRST